MTLPPPKTFRVSVPISQESLERFQRYSEVSGVSIGKSISQWLDDTSQGLEPMTEIVRGMKAVPRQTVQRLNALSTALEQTSHEVIEAARMRPGDSASLAGRRLLDAAKERAAAASPSSNTGGKVSKKVLQRPGKSS